MGSIYMTMSHGTKAMPSPTLQARLRSDRVQGLTREGTPARKNPPRPPLMRVVVEGWFGQREEKKTVEELERSDRNGS